ncbi:hypothetical protein NliqN6_3929 [Naganishia liquefaciens]|uniref:PAZ domain-containing protein n=1 Tax=Naganishia liquefaciens TaxID=104408 RepID=A0A8H3TUR5_9TREE|nr:hypothetical protein NliqN6_3929 [Naganishia liquefaciens]
MVQNLPPRHPDAITPPDCPSESTPTALRPLLPTWMSLAPLDADEAAGHHENKPSRGRRRCIMSQPPYECPSDMNRQTRPPQVAEMPQTLQPYDISKLRKVFSLCKFKLTHRPCNKIFTIMSITAKPASEITFILSGRDGAPYTVTNIAAYFRTAYNINLRYPNLPCALLPPGKFTSDQTADMVKIAAQRPAERLNRIMDWRKALRRETVGKIPS